MLAYLAAENAYTAEVLATDAALEATLFAELRSRVQEDDASVPTFDGGYWYYTRFERGKQQPIFCRRRGHDVRRRGDPARRQRARRGPPLLPDRHVRRDPRRQDPGVGRRHRRAQSVRAPREGPEDRQGLRRHRDQRRPIVGVGQRRQDALLHRQGRGDVARGSRVPPRPRDHHARAGLSGRRRVLLRERQPDQVAGVHPARRRGDHQHRGPPGGRRSAAVGAGGVPAAIEGPRVLARSPRRPVPGPDQRRRQELPAGQRARGPPGRPRRVDGRDPGQRRPLGRGLRGVQRLRRRHGPHRRDEQGPRGADQTAGLLPRGAGSDLHDVGDRPARRDVEGRALRLHVDGRAAVDVRGRRRDQGDDALEAATGAWIRPRPVHQRVPARDRHRRHPRPDLGGLQEDPRRAMAPRRSWSTATARTAPR
jgi:hypothetical protein